MTEEVKDETGLAETAAVVADAAAPEAEAQDGTAADDGAADAADPAAAQADAQGAANAAEMPAPAAEPQPVDPQARIDELEAELATTNQQLADLQAAADKAAKAASVSAGRAAGKARKINAKAVVDPIVTDGDEEARKAAVLQAIGEAERVEIVFSNGATELLALDPVEIHGDAWRVSMVGVVLTIPELIVHGPAPGKSGYALNGYGLMLDGVLRAYSARGDQLTINGGSNMNVAPDIVF